MRRTMMTVAAMATILAAGPAAAQWNLGGRVDIRVGALDHASGGSYWTDTGQYLTGGATDLDDGTVAVDLYRRSAPRSGWMLTVGAFSGETDRAYRDWVLASGAPVVHTARLEEWHLAVAYVVELAGETAPVVPYVGAGIGLYGWELTETGTFLDFGASPPEPFVGRYRADGTELGWQALAGLEVRLGLAWSLLAELRYHAADAELGSGFTGTVAQDLDLGGTEASVGVAWRW